MTIERKVGMGIAGQPSGGAADVAEVFSTYLYTGNNTTNVINNGIDLAGEGGMVWAKARNYSGSHTIWDTERGVNEYLIPNGNELSETIAVTDGLKAFNSNGFTLGVNYYNENRNLIDTVSWTFRKKEKFFDIVTYSGNSTSGRTLSHSLGSVPAMMIIKQTNGTNAWFVYHKDFIKDGAAAPNSTLFLNLNDTGDSNLGYWNNTLPTDSVFTLGNSSGDWGTNGSGETYVAYLFADNSSEDAEDQMIKCGSYTGNGTVGRTLDLGWEPQWILLKRTDQADSWFIFDTSREQTTDLSEYLRADLADAAGRAYYYIPPNATGITFNATSGGAFNTNGAEYIYAAIRAPMMIEPTVATDVFAMDTFGGGPPAFTSGFPVDFAFQKWKDGTGNWSAQARLTGRRYLKLNTTDAEATGADAFDYQNGFYNHSSTDSSVQGWMWKRAKGYMDVVAYTGNATTGRTVAHSLSVIPEMIWVKRRSDSSRWSVLHKDLTNALKLNEDIAATAGNHITATSSTNFTVTSNTGVNAVNDTYIAYLFATLDGISKVGSYTGNGSNQTIACGFSAGARFILIKRTDDDGDWYLWDSVRGIVAADDPSLSLNTTTEQENENSVGPHNSGFIVNQVSTGGATNINVSSATYIFYAIA